MGLAPSGHTQWIIVGLIGLVLTMAGTVVAGVALYAEMAGKGLPTRWVRVIRPMVNWVRRHVLRRNMNQIIKVGMASEISLTGEGILGANGYVGSADPIEDRFRRIESEIAGLNQTIERERDHNAKQFRELQEVIDTGFESLRQEVAKREEQSRAIDTLVKTQEMLGVVLVGLGTVLSGIAGFFL